MEKTRRKAMEKMLLSASFNLCPRREEYYPDYVRSGLKFYEEHGFEAAEFNTAALELLTDGWKGQMEDIMKITENSSVRFATAHLPFHSGITDKELLEKARANPAEYRDLVVRIGGYSDYFTKLSAKMQEEVILRTEHQI